MLGDLGVGAADLQRHIAWDIGVAALGVLLAERLDAVFIAQRFSRLVIDCNRPDGRPDAAPEVSDLTPIPGTQGLSAADIARRRAEISEPYQARSAAELDARAGRPTALVALHSFTPAMQGEPRPWNFGLIHGGDSPLSLAVMAGLRAEVGEAQVGDNLPYSLGDSDDTIPRHAQARGIDYLELETRQDLLADAAGQRAVADLLARVITQAWASL